MSGSGLDRVERPRRLPEDEHPRVWHRMMERCLGQFGLNDYFGVVCRQGRVAPG